MTTHFKSTIALGQAALRLLGLVAGIACAVIAANRPAWANHCDPTFLTDIGSSMVQPDGAFHTVSGDCTGSGGCNHYFDITMNGGDTLQVTFCSNGGTGNFDTGLSVWSSPPAYMVGEACVDDSCGLLSSLTFVAPAAATYRVRIGGFGGASGTYTLAYSAPAGDAIVGVANPDCGDGDIDAGETCDDGGLASGDGCSATCQVEACYSCSGTPSICAALNSGSSCGNSSDTECTNPDSCDGAGHCLTNDEPPTTACTDDGYECTQDLCDGSGACAHPSRAFGSTCGDPADTECTDPDSCDGGVTCLSNDAPVESSCGDSSSSACTAPDTCDGAGSCLVNDAPFGTSCGDSSATECTAPDTCDGGGGCSDNHAANNTPCHGGNNNTCLNACATGTCVPHFFTNCCGNGTLESSELCDDGNQMSGDECRPSCTLNLDNFECYRTSILETHADPGLKVLIDQFHTINAQIGRTRALCNPAAVNHDDLQAVGHTEHLQSYAMRTDPRKDIATVLPVRDLKIVDRFGTHYVDATRPKGLLVPTAKELSSLPQAPVSPDLDHFTCYAVKRSKARPRFTPVNAVSIDDQFSSYLINVLRPSRLCLPTNKYDEEPGAETHMAHLMCYRVRAQLSSPGRVFTNNQFGASELFVRFPNELCVAAVKNPA